jgi:hypothetical protein
LDYLLKNLFHPPPIPQKGTKGENLKFSVFLFHTAFGKQGEWGKPRPPFWIKFKIFNHHTRANQLNPSSASPAW